MIGEQTVELAVPGPNILLLIICFLLFTTKENAMFSRRILKPNLRFALPVVFE